MYSVIAAVSFFYTHISNYLFYFSHYFSAATSTAYHTLKSSFLPKPAFKQEDTCYGSGLVSSSSSSLSSLNHTLKRVEGANNNSFVADLSDQEILKYLFFDWLIL